MKGHLYMMHPQIDNQEIIERYARNQLTPSDRQEFEEHFFGCEECFEKLQATERFITGIRDAASSGRLGSRADATVASPWSAWMVPTFATSACLMILFAGFSAWMYFVQLPRVHRELAQVSADRQVARNAQAEAEALLARSNQPEANVPLAMLQAARDAQAPAAEINLPRGAQHMVLWIEVGSVRHSDFQLQINTADNRSVETLDHLRRNSHGAIAVSLPVQSLQAEEYRITLTGQEPSPAALVGEYRLRIRKP